MIPFGWCCAGGAARAAEQKMPRSTVYGAIADTDRIKTDRARDAKRDYYFSLKSWIIFHYMLPLSLF